jgi:hypothetical protein
MAGHIWGNVPIGPETEGEQTNPADDAVMADSGAITSRGIYEVLVSIGASAAAHFQVQRRNVANSGNVGDVPVIYGPAGQTGQYRFWFVLEVGERLRVVMDDALTGTAAVTVNLMQMA